MNGENPLPSAKEREIFLESLDFSSLQDRAAYIDRACGNDSTLRLSVQSLLENYKKNDLLEEIAETIRPLDKVIEKVGDTIGRYKLLKEIGEGGCGIVYQAEQQGPLHLQFALKVIKPGMDTRQVLRRFEEERKALAELEHPGIARVIDAGETNVGHPYFVMELVRGQQITDFANNNHLTISTRLELFVKVCGAIQYAHEKGFVHRDIKPSNVLVVGESTEPYPKVIDFGIAKATGGEISNETFATRTGQLIGTPNYMSPEQAAGKSIDNRTDIYSLGILLYELLVGCLPFNNAGKALQEQIKAILEIRPQSLENRFNTLEKPERQAIAQYRNIEPDDLIFLLQGNLGLIVMKCLEKDPANRYNTVDKLVADIQRFIKHTYFPSLVFELPKETLDVNSASRPKPDIADVYLSLHRTITTATNRLTDALQKYLSKDRSNIYIEKIGQINEETALQKPELYYKVRRVRQWVGKMLVVILIFYGFIFVDYLISSKIPANFYYGLARSVIVVWLLRFVVVKGRLPLMKKKHQEYPILIMLLSFFVVIILAFLSTYLPIFDYKVPQDVLSNLHKTQLDILNLNAKFHR